MRELILIFLLVGTLQPIAGQDSISYERVPVSRINPIRLEFVTSLSDRILTAQQGGGYYRFSEQEADVAIRSGMSEAVQKQAYAQLKRSFGEYRGLIFDEMLMPTEGTAYEIYRFRAQFGPNGRGVEIRAVLNPEGKLTLFSYTPWKRQL